MQILRAWLRLIWLDELFALHGMCMIGLVLYCRSLTDPSGVALTITVGVISTQVCLITVWSTWSHQPFPVRCGRLLWRMGWLYLVLLLLSSLNEERHLAMLWSLAITMGCFVLAAWLPAEILRAFRWRRIRGGALPALPPRFQFRLADVLRWTTLACVLLSVMSRFREEVSGWGGLGYAIMVAYGLFTSAPTGLVVMLLLWLALGERWTGARTIVTSFLASAWLFLSAAALYFGPMSDWINDGMAWTAIWGLTIIGTVLTLVTAGFLRFQGWRVARLPRHEKSAASPLASHQSLGGSSEKHLT